MFEVLAGGGAPVKGIVAGDAGESAGEKIGGVDAVLAGVAREVAVAADEGVVETVLKQIENVIAHQQHEDVTALRDIDTVSMTNILQSHGGAAAFVLFRVEAVFALELEGDDIILGLEEGVEGLAGDAGALAELTHADAGIGLFFH